MNALSFICWVTLSSLLEIALEPPGIKYHSWVATLLFQVLGTRGCRTTCWERGLHCTLGGEESRWAQSKTVAQGEAGPVPAA